VTKACACCHAVCTLDLRTCALCGEGSWIELSEDEAEVAKQLTHTIIDETSPLIKPRKRGRPPKRNG